MDTTGNSIFVVQKITLRQQLHPKDDQKLASLLKLRILLSMIRKYDVFVFELCDGNISKEGANG